METHPEPFKRGFSEFTRYYGILLDHLEYRYVAGFPYKTAVPVAGDDVPERIQRAEEVFARKLWREQLRDWDETFKPASIRTHRELQAIDPDSLSDEELVSHLARCQEHHSEMIYQHMRFTGAAMLPTGDFLAHVGEWTGLSPGELLGLMRGAAPVSAGASGELERLIAAIGAEPSARQLLDSDGDPAEVLWSLHSLESEAGAAVGAYLDLIGYRLLDGFDISEPYALELPDVLLRAIRAAVEGKAPEMVNVEEQTADVRSRIPEPHRAQFDELLEEARLTYRIRDERGVFSDIWACGIVRRVALGGGRRLAERGRIQAPEHFVEAGREEMRALLTGANEPSASELAERFEYRISHSSKDAPHLLGDPPSPPPDPSGLPPAAGRVMRAIGITIGALFGSSEAPHEEHLLRGLAASPGVYEGPARRVSGPAEFDRILKGDVLVTESTSEAFNILLPLLGGLVTDSGGLLSHAAIVSREYGIPGVVGTREATDRIADGARVRVDGDAGTVTVLG
jgi:pyruvate,water dikinase